MKLDGNGEVESEPYIAIPVDKDAKEGDDDYGQIKIVKHPETPGTTGSGREIT
jgi:hypothetical protein